MTTTKIEWAQAVWNPVVGCSIVSAGCSNCYAMGMAARVERCDVGGKSPQYAGLTRKSGGRSVWTGKVAAAPDAVWLAPLRRRTPTIYFVNSMGDLFHEGVPDEWIDRAFAVMALCPQHKFIVLTKRAALMRDYLSAQNLVGWCYQNIVETVLGDEYNRWSDVQGLADRWRPFYENGGPLPNVALGVSIEDQPSADDRIPHLLATPAAIRLISAEPLLGPVDLTQCSTMVFRGAELVDALTGVGFGMFGETADRVCHRLDWVIAGGESGKGSRPCHPDWARGLRDQCAAAGVPFFWKQWGDWVPVGSQPFSDPAGSLRPMTIVSSTDKSEVGKQTYLAGSGEGLPSWSLHRVGKAKAGALIDGQMHRPAPDGWLA